jgi:hypothetical protein
MAVGMGGQNLIMIRILVQPAEHVAAGVIAQDLTAAYGLTAPVGIVADQAVWADATEWNDVLLVVYRSSTLDETARAYIEAYRKAHAVLDPRTNQPAPGGVVLPVALDPGARIPHGNRLREPRELALYYRALR